MRRFEGDVRTAGGARSAGDENVVRGMVARRLREVVRIGDLENVRILGAEPRVSIDHFDAGALQLIGQHGVLALDDLGDAEHQILNLDLGLDAIAASVERALAEAAQEKNGFAQGLAGDGSGMEADAADVGAAVDDGDVLACFGGFDRRVVAGGAAADDEEVVM